MHRSPTSGLALAALAALAFLAPVGCQTPKGGDPDTAPVARIGDDTIHEAELDRFIREELFARETRGGQPARLYELRSEFLERLVAQRVVEREAERRGLTPPELVQEKMATLGPVPDDEVRAFYEEHADRLGGASFEEVAQRIRGHLERERGQRAVQALVAEAEVDILLEPPRVEVAADGPSRGPDDAAVTIVEFSDFQCPFCRRATPVLDEILERYPDDVRVVYRHLPLDDIHPRARRSAEAAECAHEQGHFWAYHDRLFENPDALGEEDLRRYAEEVGLDAARFDECLRTGRHAAKVNADLSAARAVGITGTPAFVVNGVLLFGLQSVETFDALVRDELDGG